MKNLDYQTPQVEIIEMEIEDAILAASESYDLTSLESIGLGGEI